jgi:hypothetical protein
MCISIENINNLNRIINYGLEPLLWQNGAHEQEHTNDKPQQRGSARDD